MYVWMYVCMYVYIFNPVYVSTLSIRMKSEFVRTSIDNVASTFENISFTGLLNFNRKLSRNLLAKKKKKKK